MTNFERIKEMSVEELALFINGANEGCDYGGCPALKICKETKGDCLQKLVLWLNSENTP